NMKHGHETLQLMKPQIYDYVRSIVGFAREVGALLPPSQAASMGQGVAEVLKACGAVTEQIVSAKNQLKGIKQSEGFWKFSVSVVARMYAGVSALRAMGPPIVSYIGAVVALA